MTMTLDLLIDTFKIHFNIVFCKDISGNTYTGVVCAKVTLSSATMDLGFMYAFQEYFAIA
jgi:hypothetical protein